MPVRVHGGVFNDQMITGSLRHFVIEGADFSGAVDANGQPVPGSAAEIIFINIADAGQITIMNPNQYNISFALEINRSRWDGPSLTQMVQSLGGDVGIDHIDCAVCTVTEVPYIWDLGAGPATAFLALSDVPHTYAGAAGYAVTVNPGQTGLIFTPITTPNTFSTVAVALQPTITATANDTLTFIAGTNITLTTNALAKSVRIDASGGAASNDYIPIPSGTNMLIGQRYFVTSAGTITLPALGGSNTPGQSVTITKLVSITVFVDVGNPSDEINTDLGSTDTIEFDATQELVFVVSGNNDWELQVGSDN
jgi:hypothetical protein